MKCPCCGKELTQETNNEDCPNSLYFHGKHPIFIMPEIPKEVFEYQKRLSEAMELLCGATLPVTPK